MISLKKVFFLIVCLFKLINCQDVIDSEVQCLLNIATKTQDTTLIKPNLKSSFCTSTFNRCYTNGSVSQLYVYQRSTENVTWSDFSCLKSLTYFTNQNLNSNNSFLYNIPSSIYSLSMYYPFNKNLKIEQNISKINSLTVSLENNSTVKASYLKNLQYFSSYYSTIELEIDGDQSDNLLAYLEITSNNFPDLKTFKKLKELVFTFSNSFNIESYELNSGLVNTLERITFKSESTPVSIDFPTKFTSQPNLKYTYLSFDYISIKPTNQLIDLSSNKPLSSPTISINNAPFFNYQGKFPFSSISSGLVNSFKFNYGNFSELPDLLMFSNTTYLDLSRCNIGGYLPKLPISNKLSQIYLRYNKLIGEMDESWCNLIYYDFSNNQLGGTLPNCYYCYLNNSNVAIKFTNNNFTNYTPNNVSCGYDSISIYSITSDYGFVFQVKGKNMGGDSSNLIGSPNIWTTSLSSQIAGGQFSPSIDMSKYKVVTLGFKNPPLNFTVPLNPKSPPIIDKVTQVNTSITIDGSFFSYDISFLKVTIGNKIPCLIVQSNFYQIKCEIGYPILDYGMKELEVINNGTSSGLAFKFNLDYTKFPCSIPDCNNNGLCDDHFPATCRCFNNWLTIGDDICLVANHYVSSSTKVISSQGGNITLNGLFGNINNDLKVILLDSSKELTIYSSNSNSINTSIPPTTDQNSISLKLTVTQNGITWTGLIFPYLDETLLCLNDCNGKGTCNQQNGECSCNDGYIGMDCGVEDIKEGVSKSKFEITSNALSILSNDNINYQISIDSILEIDLNKNPVPSSQYNLLYSWSLIDKSGNISTFSQTVNSATIKLIVNNQNDGDIQYSISINNWNYSSNSNNLRIIMKSNLSSTDNDCEIGGNNNIQTSSNSNLYKNNINYLKFEQSNEKVLYGKFNGKIISDNNENIIITSSTNTSTLFEINFDLPHCQNCIIDHHSEFMVLPTKESSCKSNKSSSSSNKTKVIVVAIVVPIVVVTAIVITILMLVKKKVINVKNIQMDSFKK